MYKSFIIFIIIILIIGAYGSYKDTYIQYDFSSLTSANKLDNYNIENIPAVHKEPFLKDYLHMTVDPLQKIQLNNVKYQYLIVEFDNPLTAFSKIKLVEDLKVTDYPSGSNNYFVCKISKKENPYLLVYDYGIPKIKNIYNLDNINYTISRNYNCLYGAIYICVILALLFLLLHKFNIELHIPKQLKNNMILYMAIFILYYFISNFLASKSIISMYRLKQLFFMLCIVFSVYVILKFKNALDIAVPLLIIIIATLFIFSIGFAAYSWDESEHFKRSLESLSFGNMNYSISVQNYNIIDIDVDIFKYDSFYRSEFTHRLNLSYWEPYTQFNRHLTFSNVFFSIPYIANGVMLLIFRCFRFPPYQWHLYYPGCQA